MLLLKAHYQSHNWLQIQQSSDTLHYKCSSYQW